VARSLVQRAANDAKILDFLGELPRHCDGMIRRSIVDHNDFRAGYALAHDATGARQERRRVEAWNDD